MPVSTNVIFHYTNSLEVLKLILREGFKLNYCLEKLQLGVGYTTMAHPIVCFCDIPISQSKKHIAHYGKYGIGLSKEWAFNKRINPIMYVDRRSLIADLLHKLLKLGASSKKTATMGGRKKIQRMPLNSNTAIMKCCMKNYSGVSKEDSDYRFYDEREWRFIPDKEKDLDFIRCNANISVSLDDYENYKDELNNKISDYRLKFGPDDIKYIIVQTKDELTAIIEFLRTHYPCTPEQFNILLTKICTFDSIESDY
ncbi:MAG: hypothetical protein K2I64_02660 [Muribaculaceae bacterium]|nr:hypothetical protein [Muribaculaceae bacterium]